MLVSSLLEKLTESRARADRNGPAKPMRRSRKLRRSEASHLEIDSDAGTSAAGMCLMGGKSMITDTMVMTIMLVYSGIYRVDRRLC